MLSLNPWTNIWIHPKKTIKEIVAYNPNFRLWVLSTIFGFSSLMYLEQIFSPGLKYSLKAIILFSLLIAPFWGYFVFCFLSFLVHRVGKLMNSKASYSDVRAVASWSCVPYSISSLVWIILIFFFGNDLFKNFPQNTSITEVQMSFVLAALGIKLTMTTWSFFIYIQGLSLIQGFNIPKTILNIVFAMLIVSVIIFLLWSAIVNTCGYFYDVPLVTFRF